MGRMFDDKYVMCPYFVKQDAMRIHCEGWCDEHRTTSITAFDTSADKRKYTVAYCNSPRWDRCPLCRLIASKYGD